MLDWMFVVSSDRSSSPGSCLHCIEISISLGVFVRWLLETATSNTKKNCDKTDPSVIRQLAHESLCHSGSSAVLRKYSLLRLLLQFKSRRPAHSAKFLEVSYNLRYF